jgi:hypothetical protein
MERYISIAPGIEVSVAPHEEPGWERSSEASVYNRQGRMDFSLKKGFFVDPYF